MRPLAVSISDMCASIGCKRSHVYELIRRGEVVAVKLGRKTVVTVASIEVMLERNAVARPAEPDKCVPDCGPAVPQAPGHSCGMMCQLACNIGKQKRSKPADLAVWQG